MLLGGRLTDRGSAAAARVPPYHRPDGVGASYRDSNGGRPRPPHTADRGCQLQPLVRQPSAPRDETNRLAHHPALELAGRRRGVPLAREAMRSQLRGPATLGCQAQTLACATDPRRRRTPHTAATRRDLAPVDRSSHRCPHQLGEDLARPRDHAARGARGDGGAKDRRRGVSPSQRVYETDGTRSAFARRRPATPARARHPATKTRRRDGAAPTSRTLLAKNSGAA
jgi:hypothetical protein